MLITPSFIVKPQDPSMFRLCFGSLHAEFHLQDASDLRIRKLYSSELYFTDSPILATITEKFSNICELFAKFSGVNELLKQDAVQVGSLSFLSDPADRQTARVFKVERAIAEAFSEGRFYSSAPLTTDAHIELLNALEESLV